MDGFLGPIQTNPFSNENGADLLRIRLSSTLQRRKRSPKTEPLENALQSGAIWKRCFLVWTEKTMLPENGAVIKIDTTGCQTTRPWVFKSADKCYHVDFLLIGMTSSLWTRLQAHLTQLRRHIDFTRRKQDILRLLTLPASGKTKTKRLSRSPPPVLGFGCFPAVLASLRMKLKYQRILNHNIPQNWIHNSLPAKPRSAAQGMAPQDAHLSDGFGRRCYKK